MILSQMVKILKNGFLVKLFGKYKITSYNSFYHDMFVQVPSTLNNKEKFEKSLLVSNIIFIFIFCLILFVWTSRKCE